MFGPNIQNHNFLNSAYYQLEIWLSLDLLTPHFRKKNTAKKVKEAIKLEKDIEIQGKLSITSQENNPYSYKLSGSDSITPDFWKAPLESRSV